jgi:hypothetical protein
MCGYMFQALVVILRLSKCIKIKITIAISIVEGQTEISIFGVTKCMSVKIFMSIKVF